MVDDNVCKEIIDEIRSADIEKISSRRNTKSILKSKVKEEIELVLVPNFQLKRFGCDKILNRMKNKLLKNLGIK